LLVNNPNIREWASAFATRFSTQPTRTLSDAVHQAYSLAFNRAPSPTELSVGVQFVEAQQAEYRTGAVPNASHLAFTDFALALFSLNEFIYLD
jgi:hypothetical protein